MKYVVQIDDNDQENKPLIDYLRSLAMAGRKIEVLTEDEAADAELLRLMEKGKQSGEADTDEVLSFLKQSK